MVREAEPREADPVLALIAGLTTPDFQAQLKNPHAAVFVAELFYHFAL